MKRIEFKHMLMGLAVLMTSSMSAQDLLNYSVIHHAGMSIEIHDTVVDPATGFTIEDYLDMLGYDSDEAEIIEITDEMDFVSFSRRGQIILH